MVQLSQKETDILHLLLEGKTNKEIAESKNLNPTVIKSILETLYTKLKVTNRLQAVIMATKLDLM